MPDIILPICPIQPGTPTISSYNRSAVSISGNDILIGIEPISRCISNEILIPLQPESPALYYCNDEDWLSWQRNKTEGDIYTEPILEDWPTITIQHPSCCHWAESIVIAYQPDPVSYLIFENGGDAFGGSYSEHVIENQIYPGARLTVEHVFNNSQYTKRFEADFDWWNTCCFTGGTVKEIVGNYGFPDIYYIVESNGVEIPAKPTDFVNWEVGDWVWLARPGGSCSDIARKDACKAAGNVADTPEAPENVSNIILAFVNETRENVGLPPLTLSAQLTEAAKRHVEDMGKNCFLSHYGSDDSTITERVQETGYCIDFEECAVGENIGYGMSAAHVYSLWLESPGHYQNITDPNWLEMGIASYNINCQEINDEIHGTINNIEAKGVIMFCQVFGNRGNTDPPPDDEESPLVYFILPAGIGA